MISKKFSIIAMISVVAVASGYGIYELSPPTVTIYSGGMQFTDRTFEEDLNVAGIVVEGTIQSVGIVLHTEEYTEADENGNQVVFDTKQVPHQEITIKIKKIYKDNYGLDGSKTVIVYGRFANGEIGFSNGQKAKFVSQYGIDYEVGQKGLFLIENDSRLWLNGFSDFYPIDDENQETIKTKKHEKFHEDYLNFTLSKESAKKLGK